MVIKDKVLIGISGGEFGVHCHVTAYDLKTGRRVMARLLARVRTTRFLVDPEKTTEFGKPIGKDSSLKTWQGDQWKIGGGCTWGWISYDPQLNLFYYGSGNPSTWNPKPAARRQQVVDDDLGAQPDNGQAKWVYQMTPHDEWDYDGVNEMILADQQHRRPGAQAAGAFRSQRLRLYARPRQRRAARRREVRSDGQLDQQVDMNKISPDLWPADGPAAVFDRAKAGRELKGICPAALGTKDEQPAAFSPDTGLFYVPTNHVCMDYEPFRVSYTAGQPYVGATLSMYPPPGKTNMGNFIAWDARTGKIVWSLQGAVLGLVRCSRDSRRRGVLRDARRLSEGR